MEELRLRDVFKEDSITTVPTYEQKERLSKKQRVGKAGYSKPKSRKKCYKGKRVPVRDSKRVYHGGVMKCLYFSDMKDAPKPRHDTNATELRRSNIVVDSLTDLVVLHGDHEISLQDEIGESVVNDETSQNLMSLMDESSQTDESQASQLKAVVATALTPAKWPANVLRIKHTLNPNGIPIRDIQKLSWCECSSRCLIDVCPNACENMFCANNNCVLQNCGNRLQDVN
ncbi:hypothetical protein AC1031_021568, partial [Aphanomyces cochlioides]